MPYSQDNLREILRSQRLKSVQDVLDIYGNGLGCEVCKPALSYMLDMIWCGDHDEDRSARFINDRVHANIQKDGTFSVVPRMRGGVTTPAELRRIADVAEQIPGADGEGHRQPAHRSARRSRRKICRRCGPTSAWPSGQAYTKGVRMVKTCVGTEFCRFGVQDSTAAGIELETPARASLHAAQSEDGRGRLSAQLRRGDGQGHRADRQRRQLAGRGRRRRRQVGPQGRSAHHRRDDRARRSKPPSSSSSTTASTATTSSAPTTSSSGSGIDKVRKETVYAPDAVRHGLLDRLRKSKALAKDAWLEGETPMHPTQFIPLQSIEKVPV